MTDFDISNGNTDKIINEQRAQKVLSDENDAEGFIIYTDGDIRLVREESREQARHGLPVKQGTHITNLDPKGAEMYAYNDENSGSVTVTVQLQKYTMEDMG